MEVLSNRVGGFRTLKVAIGGEQEPEIVMHAARKIDLLGSFEGRQRSKTWFQDLDGISFDEHAMHHCSNRLDSWRFEQ